MTSLITSKLRNNDDGFFKKFSNARKGLEGFLVENKSLIAIALQNMSKAQRIPKMKDLFEYLINQVLNGNPPTAEAAVAHLGLRGRILDVNVVQTAPHFNDDTKSMVFVGAALATALKCPICEGYLHPSKSVSYDHVTRIRDGGTGDSANAQMVHPFCNTGMKA